jgi:hypothetical protein
MLALVRCPFPACVLAAMVWLLSAAIAADPARPPLAESLDTGIAGSRNFTVLAPRGDHLADKILSRAEELRREIALDWLGEELPEGKGLTHITLKISKDKDEGLTLLCGPGRATPGDNRLWLETSPERATGTTLAHEVTHIVMAVRFPKGLPVWANEGMASLQDDEERHKAKQELVRQWARSGQWPSLDRLLYLREMPPSDQASYAAAVSLTEFLLSKGERRALIDCIEQSQQDGWNAALGKCYGIASIAELQRQWQEWAAR